MSEFDKEAEREKLRQQYEKDKEGRKATQRMSELLLQGATMTGKHCDTCGDPIFRYDGTEFCPTCQHETGEVEAADSESGGAQADETQAAETGVNGGATDDGGVADETGVEVEAPDAGETGSGKESPERRPSEPTTGDPATPRSESRRAPPSQTDGSQDAFERSRSRAPRDASSGRRERDSGGVPTASGGDLAEARSALVRKLTRLAREAEETGDVARARDLLAATREAAEALAALDRANR